MRRLYQHSNKFQTGAVEAPIKRCRNGLYHLRSNKKGTEPFILVKVGVDRSRVALRILGQRYDCVSQDMKRRVALSKQHLRS